MNLKQAMAVDRNIQAAQRDSQKAVELALEKQFKELEWKLKNLEENYAVFTRERFAIEDDLMKKVLEDRNSNEKTLINGKPANIET